MSVFCNNCEHLNYNEFEQRKLKEAGYDVPHYCKKYKKRLYHKTNDRHHSNVIHPCELCELENIYGKRIQQTTM